MVGDHFRLAVVGALAAQQIVNVFHYRQSTGNTSTLSDVESLARAWDAKFLSGSARLINVQAQAMAWKTIESRTFPLPGDPLLGYDLATTLTGVVEEVALPPTVAAVIRRKTARLGRAYRGRIFIAGLGIGTTASGLINDAGTITDLGDLATALFASLTWTAGGSPTFIPEIATILKSGPGPVFTYTYRANDIVSATVDLVLRSQRRREVGRGS